MSSGDETERGLSEQVKFWATRDSFSNYLGHIIVAGGNLYYGDEEDEGADLLPNNDVLRILRNADLQTQAGFSLKEVMQGNDIIDIACGSPRSSILLRLVSKSYGANSYFGVDMNLPGAKELSLELSREEDFAISYQQSDALKFLKDLKPSARNRVFCIFGLQPLDDNHIPTQNYVDSCLTAISAVSKSGDSVVVGMGTGGAFVAGKPGYPVNYGFELTGSFAAPMPRTRGRGRQITHLSIYRKK